MVTMAKVDVQSSVEHHRSHEEANEIYTALRVISIEKNINSRDLVYI